MAKKSLTKLNKLQIAQLTDCINNGMTFRQKKKEGQPKPAPLFIPETEQTKLF